MNALRMLAVVFGIAVLVAAFGSRAKAEEFNKLTIFTFSQPVEIPGGKVLPAGTYSFKVLDTMGDRNIVQIFNKDQTKLYATFLTISDYRRQPTDKPIVRFSETTAGAPEAIKEWFYPGEQEGWEFVYPKSRAVELAKVSNQPVPSMPSNLSSNISQPANDASMTAMKNAPIKSEEASGQEAEVTETFGNKPVMSASNTTPSNPATNAAPAQQQAANTLPKTASAMPLFALTGIFLLVAGALLWVVSKRTT